MTERLEEVISDRDLLVHARRKSGEALPVLVKVRGATPTVEVSKPRTEGLPGARRPLRVSVTSRETLREDAERLESVAATIEKISGETPTVLKAAQALAIELDPAMLRAVAELEEIQEIVPNRRHGPPRPGG